MNWTRKWPTEKGWYWFYGHRFGKSQYNAEPEMLPVHVWHVSGGEPAWVVGGRHHFMYQSEGAVGFWLPMEVPEPPDEDPACGGADDD